MDICNYSKHQLTSALIEASNDITGMIRKRARGIHDTDYFKLKIRQTSVSITGVFPMQISKKLSQDERRTQDRRRTALTNKVTVETATIVPRLQLNLIAREDITKGEVIVFCSFDEIRRERSWRTIQVDYNRHVKNDLLDYVDHSCDPNAAFITEDLALVALKSINAGERITFFYPGTEVELANDFICTCGSSTCVGHLKGGFYLTPEQMRWAIDKGYCTSFIKEQFTRLLAHSE